MKWQEQTLQGLWDTYAKPWLPITTRTCEQREAIARLDGERGRKAERTRHEDEIKRVSAQCEAIVREHARVQFSRGPDSETYTVAVCFDTRMVRFGRDRDSMQFFGDMIGQQIAGEIGSSRFVMSANQQAEDDHRRYMERLDDMRPGGGPIDASTPVMRRPR